MYNSIHFVKAIFIHTIQFNINYRIFSRVGAVNNHVEWYSIAATMPTAGRVQDNSPRSVQELYGSYERFNGA